MSDGEKRMFRVAREVGDDKERRFTQPLTRSVARAASHSAPRGFPIVTVNVSDPKSSRTRSTSEFSQHSAVIHVRDKDPTRPTVIPVTRSSPAPSHCSSSPVKTSRPSSRRAVQVEQFDSKSVTIPAPTAASRHPRPREENMSSPAPLLWTPLKRPPDERDSRRWQEIDVEKEISIREQELYIARQTIRKKRSPVMGTPTKFDPAAIKLECERMMAVLRQERSSEEELADASEVDREIERLKREARMSQSEAFQAASHKFPVI
ncbi:unnamed protein product [Heligmosomoides polygyrus]|uniref:Uncharacterized protein n=1 Tax=Heligmosomoides polygyrus TaxID=6339 RepID=A0A3P8BQZ1_HELPZ|nr:unnamed protein product [Heligmosomoides polygyrus]